MFSMQAEPMRSCFPPCDGLGVTHTCCSPSCPARIAIPSSGMREVAVRQAAAGNLEGTSLAILGDGPVRCAELSHPSAQDFPLIEQHDIPGAV